MTQYMQCHWLTLQRDTLHSNEKIHKGRNIATKKNNLSNNSMDSLTHLSLFLIIDTCTKHREEQVNCLLVVKHEKLSVPQ